MIYYLDDVVTSFDFDPSGEKAAILDFSGACIISDIATNSRLLRQSLDKEGNLFSRILFIILFQPILYLVVVLD